MRDLKILLLQSDIIWHSPDKNIAKIDDFLSKQRLEADLFLLPEMFTTGFTMKPEGISENFKGDAVEAMIKWSKSTGAYVAGTVPFFDNGFHYNRLLLVSSSGVASFYDKRHLFSIAGEDKIYTSGSKKLIFDIFGWKVAFFICYDLRFPVWIRNRDNDFDVAVFLANWPYARREHWNALLRARAIENLSYVVGVNRVGIDGNGIVYSGDSQVINFKGDILLGCGDVEKFFSIELSYKELASYRESFPAWLDADKFMLV
ncbi:MAG TPA: amidohydrolase [Spirochaetota bacterium]|nr:amidohydrolase [Spirochaetota bacterium]HOK92629.1 amidohydrolase [Spirochaetota bacterium]HON15740.1 amidohydrolase [Spirochaetota bacterium]HPD76962.1 amidohydrolase [Spirochaetota bacterium]HPP94973.1 amidohydrolase [Spirochaetota bacterium]